MNLEILLCLSCLMSLIKASISFQMALAHLAQLINLLCFQRLAPTPWCGHQSRGPQWFEGARAIQPTSACRRPQQSDSAATCLRLHFNCGTAGRPTSPGARQRGAKEAQRQALSRCSHQTTTRTVPCHYRDLHPTQPVVILSCLILSYLILSSSSLSSSLSSSPCSSKQ